MVNSYTAYVWMKIRKNMEQQDWDVIRSVLANFSDTCFCRRIAADASFNEVLDTLGDYTNSVILEPDGCTVCDWENSEEISFDKQEWEDLYSKLSAYLVDFEVAFAGVNEDYCFKLIAKDGTLYESEADYYYAEDFDEAFIAEKIRSRNLDIAKINRLLTKSDSDPAKVLEPAVLAAGHEIRINAAGDTFVVTANTDPGGPGVSVDVIPKGSASYIPVVLVESKQNPEYLVNDEQVSDICTYIYTDPADDDYTVKGVLSAAEMRKAVQDE